MSYYWVNPLLGGLLLADVSFRGVWAKGMSLVTVELIYYSYPETETRCAQRALGLTLSTYYRTAGAGQSSES